MDIPIWLGDLLNTLNSPFWVGLVVTLFFTAIPGPMNVVVVEQTLEKGTRAGTLLGLANCFGAIGTLFIAALPFLFGIEALTKWLIANKATASGMMGVALLVMGAYMIRSPDVARKAPPKIGYVIWAFFYTALHPGNALINITLITSLQAAGSISQPADILAMMLAYFLGTGFVWAGYVSAASLTRQNVNAGMMHRIKTIMGGIIIAFGLVGLAYLFAF